MKGFSYDKERQILLGLLMASVFALVVSIVPKRAFLAAIPSLVSSYLNRAGS